MQFCSKRREFLKFVVASLSYPTTQNILRSVLVTETLYITNSHAETMCSLLTVDSTRHTVDSTLINLSYTLSTIDGDSDCDGLTDADEVAIYNTIQIR